MKVELRRAVYEANDARAALIRASLRARGLFTVNVLGGPGSGKTTLITRLAERLGAGRVAVIEGDIASDIDTRRLRSLGVRAWQIETGGDCHLNAAMMEGVLGGIEAEGGFGGADWLFIENIGNLVCPAEFVIGEELKLVVVGTTEGSDKPWKYPIIFNKSAACVLSKYDAAAAFGFDEAFFREGLASAAPGLPLFPVDGRRGGGVEALAAWLEGQRAAICAREGEGLE